MKILNFVKVTACMFGRGMKIHGLFNTNYSPTVLFFPVLLVPLSPLLSVTADALADCLVDPCVLTIVSWFGVFISSLFDSVISQCLFV